MKGQISRTKDSDLIIAQLLSFHGRMVLPWQRWVTESQLSGFYSDSWYFEEAKTHLRVEWLDEGMRWDDRKVWWEDWCLSDSERWRFRGVALWSSVSKQMKTQSRGQQLDEVSEINMPLNACLHASAHLWPRDDLTLTGTAAGSVRRGCRAAERMHAAHFVSAVREIWEQRKYSRFLLWVTFEFEHCKKRKTLFNGFLDR